ncbi:MAG: hypothetical protein ABEI52_04490 [Halobacteriaceae archaeon]
MPVDDPESTPRIGGMYFVGAVKIVILGVLYIVPLWIAIVIWVNLQSMVGPVLGPIGAGFLVVVALGLSTYIYRLVIKLSRP